MTPFQPFYQLPFFLEAHVGGLKLEGICFLALLIS
jgi:hypothetical protein